MSSLKRAVLRTVIEFSHDLMGEIEAGKKGLEALAGANLKNIQRNTAKAEARQARQKKEATKAEPDKALVVLGIPSNVWGCCQNTLTLLQGTFSRAWTLRFLRIL